MGWSSLRAAVHFGHMECARLLLEHGAHVDLADSRGDTPLIGVLLANSAPEPMSRLLLSYGANATRCNQAGNHALSIARHDGRCVACVLQFRDAAERHSLREAARLQPALDSLLRTHGLELKQNATRRLLERDLVTMQALAEDDYSEALQQMLEIDSDRASALLAAARAAADQALADAQEDAKRLAKLKDKLEPELWDILARLHLVDDHEMMEVLLREKFFHLDTLTGMLYSDQIKYGVNPQHVRAIKAEMAAAAAPKPRHPSPRGASGKDWRPHDDL